MQDYKPNLETIRNNMEKLIFLEKLFGEFLDNYSKTLHSQFSILKSEKNIYI